eukprot:Polyplicarium_translucidae@DN2220_c0_g1_i2.p2
MIALSSPHRSISAEAKCQRWASDRFPGHGIGTSHEVLLLERGADMNLGVPIEEWAPIASQKVAHEWVCRNRRWKARRMAILAAERGSCAHANILRWIRDYSEVIFRQIVLLI